MNACGTFIEWRYSLEPGDGTRYQFSLVDMGTFVPVICSELYEVVGGVDDSYVRLAILMPSGQGSYEISREQLADLRPYFVQYYANHISREVEINVILPIMLAASVLVNNHRAIDEAVAKMATWREVYKMWFKEN